MRKGAAKTSRTKKTNPFSLHLRRLPTPGHAGSTVEVSIDAEEDEEERYEEDAHKLRTELALEKPSRKVIKKLMKKTYN